MISVPPPKSASDPGEELWFHVVAWDDVGFADQVVPGWTQVHRNPKYGFHFNEISSVGRVTFRRPGDSQSFKAVIDAWKTVGELPSPLGPLRGCLRFCGSSKVDVGSAPF